MSGDLPQPGEIVSGRYTIKRELGHGGMAFVYLARDGRVDRDVALKVLRPELAGAVGTERFVREIRIEATLQHPAILALYDFGDVNGLPYYVMPFLTGETLGERLAREGPLPLEDALSIVREVGEALSYAHSLGIVHRDIKPANILLSGGHAYVADFGVARAITVAGGEQLTATGLTVGTPAYMSPEQAGDPEAVDQRSDLYSLVCVLFEMLVGEPPFTGRTAQAIIARHMAERPPSLTVVRPGLPMATVRAVERGLAKVPADRFPTVAGFCEALKAPVPQEPTRHTWPALLGSTAGRLILAAVTAAVVVGGWWLAQHRSDLDPDWVTVFPLRDEGEGAPAGRIGNDVAAYLGFVLEGSDPLHWAEGRDGLTPQERESPSRLTLERMRAISRAHGAAHFIEGSIVRRPDSVTVVLLLYDTRRGRLLKRAGRSGPATAVETQLGALAVGDLLPVLLEPGRKAEVSAWLDRHPAAIAQYILGDQAYRLTHWDTALAHYQSAVKEDSAFAMAAIKGAQAAAWMERTEEATALLQTALRGERLLPVRMVDFARGLRAYMAGSADSAVSAFRRALAARPDWSEAWMALGEVYMHLLPRADKLDSLAETAFNEARGNDSTFSPPLFHLTEIAFRNGELRKGDRLLAEFSRAHPDSTLQVQLALMRGCIAGDAAGSGWRIMARRHPAEALQAGVSLGAGARWTRCALMAFHAVLAADSAAANDRWNALLGLQSLFVAQGQLDSVRAILEAPEAKVFPAVALLYLIDAVAGAGFDREAATTIGMLGGDIETLSPLRLWYLGTWLAWKGDRGQLATVMVSLARRASESGDPADRVRAQSLAARLALLRGDSVQALRILRELRPVATRPEISWGLWEPLAAERLLEARLLLEHGQLAEAERVAASLDDHPITYLLYLQASLELRLRAAEGQGQQAHATEYRRRLSSLGRDRVAAGTSLPP